jgi:activator of 2-hydroxyglutaryl-CoA dehydratase
MHFCADCPPTVNAALMLCADNGRYYRCSICRRFYDASEIRPMTTPEGVVKKEIKKWLDVQKVYYFMPVQTGYGRRTVDILLCWHGQFVAVEVKRPGGTAKKFQARIIADVIKAGGVGVSVDSLQALQFFLEDQDWRANVA